jgi:hypothetical protein
MLHNVLNERRRRVYPRLFLITVAFWLVVGGPAVWAFRAKHGQTYGADFITVWSAASLAGRGDAPQVYEFAPLYYQELTVTRNALPDQWHYPPQALVLLLPLAFLPYAIALGVWEVVTGGLFLLVFRRAISAPHRIAASLLALPALIVAYAFGQNGFLTGTLLGAGLLLLEDRPLVGGGLLGLITYKPQLAPLAFIALLAGRRWRALGSAVCSAALLALASLAIFGVSTWQAFLTDLRVSTKMLDASPVWSKMTTVNAAVGLAGGSPAFARVVQVFVAVVVVAAVAWLWQRNTARPIRYAALAVGTLLATPYAFIYDLPLAVLAIAWLFQTTGPSPWRPWERVAIGLVAVLPLTTWPLAAYTSVQLAPLFLAALFVIIVRRGVQYSPAFVPQSAAAATQPALDLSATARI